MQVRAGRQLSLFGVEAAEPAPADLAGLLAGPGQVVRMGGTARVSVVVDAAWRVHVLAAECAARGLATSWVRTADRHLGVRTAYAASLAPLARAWLRGAVKHPPAGFHLDGQRLRLWVAAAGSCEQLGFLLRLGPADERCWDAVGAALAAIGLPAVLVTPRSGGPRTGEPPLVGQLVAGGQGPPDREGAADAEDQAVGGTRTGADGAPEAGRPGGEAAGGKSAGGGPAGGEAAGGGPAGGEAAGGGPAGGEAAGGGPAGGERAGGERAGGERAGGEPGRLPIGGPAYRITGRRRLARLAELVGERPAAAPSEAWPA